MATRLAVRVACVAWIGGGTVAAQWSRGPAWAADGEQARAAFGCDVRSAGDVNGDGLDDLLVAANGYDGGEVDEGQARLYLGSREGLAKTPSWTFETDQAFAHVFPVAAAGDVNGDGFDDVLVGSPGYSNGEYLEGRVWLYLGSASGLSTVPAWIEEGNQEGLYFGAGIDGAGDVNGDGYDDVLVSLGGYSNGQQNEGAVRLYLGSDVGLGTSPAWQAEGNQAFCEFVQVRRVGDVNGDGFDDVLVGATGFNAGDADEGKAFLYLGSPTGPSSTPDWTAEGNSRNALFGQPAMGAGDVNGDGYDDVVIGAQGHDALNASFGAEGRAYLYLGSPLGLSPLPAWIGEGSQGGEGFGAASPAGDVDGDGYDDLLVGGPGYDGSGAMNQGRVALYFGSPLGLGPRAGWIRTGGQRNAGLGAALCAAGDLNGDGFADFALGCERFRDERVGEGRVWAFHGASRLRIR